MPRCLFGVFPRWKSAEKMVRCLWIWCLSYWIISVANFCVNQLSFTKYQENGVSERLRQRKTSLHRYAECSHASASIFLIPLHIILRLQHKFLPRVRITTQISPCEVLIFKNQSIRNANHLHRNPLRPSSDGVLAVTGIISRPPMPVFWKLPKILI